MKHLHCPLYDCFLIIICILHITKLHIEFLGNRQLSVTYFSW